MLLHVLLISVGAFASSPSEISHSDDNQGLWTKTYEGCMMKFPGQEARCTDLANTKHPIQPIGPDKPLKDVGRNDDGPGRPGGSIETPVDGSPTDTAAPMPASGLQTMQASPRLKNKHPGPGNRGQSRRSKGTQTADSPKSSGMTKGSSSVTGE